MLFLKKIIKKIKKYFNELDKVIAVYLFGSLAKETFNDNSDIDLALMLEDDLDKVTVFDLKLKVMGELESLLDYEVDIVIFSQADLRLQHQIIKGQLLKGKDNKQRVKREQKSLDQYLDMKYFYDRYEEKLGKGLEYG
mgnify:CR=1 FL=1